MQNTPVRDEDSSAGSQICVIQVWFDFEKRGGGVISEKPRGNHVAAAAADDRIESRRHSALIFTTHLCHHFSYSWLKSASFILEIVVELNSLTTYKPHH